MGTQSTWGNIIVLPPKMIKIIAIALVASVVFSAPTSSMPTEVDETTDRVPKWYWRAFSAVPDVDRLVKKNEEEASHSPVPEGNTEASPESFTEDLSVNYASGHHSQCDKTCLICQHGIIDTQMFFKKGHCKKCAKHPELINDDPRCMECASENAACHNCLKCRETSDARKDCAPKCKDPNSGPCKRCMVEHFITEKVHRECHDVCKGKQSNTKKCKACYRKNGRGKGKWWQLRGVGKKKKELAETVEFLQLV